ncbi:MAG: helix-turn-helix domain-containing protein [Beutenbergiaceae bacterium]
MRSIGKDQTFLSEAQIDQVVDLYQGGMSMNKIAERFRAHRHTIAAHLVRRSVPLRSPRSLDPADIPEAVRCMRRG